MARVTYVKAAQASKRPRACHKCHEPINVGDSYKWFASRIGRMTIRKDFCDTCTIRPSDQTTSDKLSALYLAVETAEDAIEGLTEFTLSDLGEILRECAEAVREVAGEYAESASNIEEGFGHPTSQSEDIQQKADDVESFADSLESCADEIDGMDDPDADEETLHKEWPDAPDDESDQDDDESEDAGFAEWAEGERERRREEAISRANDALTELPL